MTDVLINSGNPFTLCMLVKLSFFTLNIVYLFINYTSIKVKNKLLLKRKIFITGLAMFLSYFSLCCLYHLTITFIALKSFIYNSYLLTINMLLLVKKCGKPCYFITPTYLLLPLDI